jgi:hypothetical protein
MAFLTGYPVPLRLELGEVWHHTDNSHPHHHVHAMTMPVILVVLHWRFEG